MWIKPNLISPYITCFWTSWHHIFCTVCHRLLLSKHFLQEQLVLLFHFSPLFLFWSRALLPVFGIHPGSSLISKAGMLGNWKVYGWQESSGFGFISPTLFLDGNRCQLSSLFFYFIAFFSSVSLCFPTQPWYSINGGMGERERTWP